MLTPSPTPTAISLTAVPPLPPPTGKPVDVELEVGGTIELAAALRRGPASLKKERHNW